MIWYGSDSAVVQSKVIGFSILVVMRIHCIGFRAGAKFHLSEHKRMKYLQYGTGCAEECSDVTESTVPYLLNYWSR